MKNKLVLSLLSFVFIANVSLAVAHNNTKGNAGKPTTTQNGCKTCSGCKSGKGCKS